MKKIVLIITTAMLISCSMSQNTKENDVPSNVVAAFNKQFPNATEIKWEKEGRNYEAKFEINEGEYGALFDAQSNLIETEVEIATNQFPVGVLEYLNVNYKGKKIDDAAQITDAKGNMTYEAEIEGLVILFDNDGKFIKSKRDR